MSQYLLLSPFSRGNIASDRKHSPLGFGPISRPKHVDDGAVLPDVPVLKVDQRLTGPDSGCSLPGFCLVLRKNEIDCLLPDQFVGFVAPDRQSTRLNSSHCTIA